jgi:hypothetical protein
MFSDACVTCELITCVSSPEPLKRFFDDGSSEIQCGPHMIIKGRSSLFFMWFQLLG